MEMGRQLAALGHEALLISNGAERLPPEDDVAGLPVRRLRSVNLFRYGDNPELVHRLAAEAPDVILWHLSLSSFLHQDLHHVFAGRTIGVVTSPVYAATDVVRLGITKLSTNPEMIATHFTGTLVPSALYRQALGRGGLAGLITLSETTRCHLIDRGTPPERVWVVPPGVDDAWLNASVADEDRVSLRGQLGYTPDDFVVIYFGSPAPVRGLNTTLAAVEQAARRHRNLRLVILSRRRSGEWQKAAFQLERLINRGTLRGRVQVVDGFLSQDELIRHISASDLVCLPFELVPSDVPLSILEAMALSQPVIGTRIACIPEMLEDARGFLVPPGSARSLAHQIEAIVAAPGSTAEIGRAARAYVVARGTWAEVGPALLRVMQAAGLAGPQSGDRQAFLAPRPVEHAPHKG